MTVIYNGDEDRDGTFPANPAELHASRALEQAARYQADLAISRWSGADVGGGGISMPARAAWLTEAQNNLQQWLADGGFGQYGHSPAPTEACDGAALPFPGSRPMFYTVFRNARSTAD